MVRRAMQRSGGERERVDREPDKNWFAEWVVVSIVCSTLVFSTIHCPDPFFLVVYYALLAGPLLLARDASASAAANAKGCGHQPLNESGLIARMRDAQEARESWLECAVGDQLRVIRFADMAEAAFELSDARWAPSLRAYLDTTGTVQEVDAASVKLVHEDGQAIWWAYGAVKVTQRRLKRKPGGETSLTCMRGDVMQIMHGAEEVEAAFAGCDARWALALVKYLGQSGVVESVHLESVLIKHADGQCIWWPYSVASVLSRALRPVRTCACGDMLKTPSDGAVAAKAFEESDASYTESIAKHYLATVGVVEQVDHGSIFLRHADGQGIWWPMASLSMHDPCSVPAAGSKEGQATSGRVAVASSSSSRAGAGWCGLCAYMLAVSAGVGAFGTMHTPHPLFMLLYFGILTTSFLSSEAVSALVATSKGAAGAICAGAVSMLAVTVVLNATGVLSSPVFVACYYLVFTTCLYLTQSILTEQSTAVQAFTKLASEASDAAARAVVHLLCLAAGIVGGLLTLSLVVVYPVAAAARLAPEATAHFVEPLLGSHVYSMVAGAAATCRLMPFLAVLVLAAGTWALKESSAPQVRLFYKSTGPMQSILWRCPSLLRGFSPSPWLLSGHIMTLTVLARRRASILYTRELLPTPDGGQISLDWVSRTHTGGGARRGGEGDSSGRPILVSDPLGSAAVCC